MINAQLDQWVIIGNMPNPVADAAMVFYQTGMYVMGGYSESTQSSVDFIQKYDYVNNSWQNSELLMVSPRRAFVSAAYSREIFSLGGVTPGAQHENSIEVWDFFNPSIIAGNNSHFNRKSSAGVVYGGRLFVFGGNPEQVIPNINYPYILKYNLSSNTFGVVEDQVFANRKLPEQQMTEIFQSQVYIFGGVLNGITQDIYKFDISNETLIKLDIKLLEPRAAGQAVVFGDESYIFIMGGYNESSEALKSVEVFSFENNEYSIWNAPEMNIARTNFMASYSNNKFFVMGGFDEMGKVVSSIETFEPGLTSVEKNSYIPIEYELMQNYPNPFNPATNISFKLSRISNVSITVYSVSGEYVCTLLDSELGAGEHSVKWNGKGSNGMNVASGVYIYTMNSNNFNVSHKMVLLR